MLAVAIGRFDQHRVGVSRRRRWIHDVVVWTAHIAAEQNATSRHLNQDAGCPQDVASRLKRDIPTRDGRKGFAHAHGVQQIQAQQRIMLGVQRHGGRVLGVTVAVQKRRVFFLNVAHKSHVACVAWTRPR